MITRSLDRMNSKNGLNVYAEKFVASFRMEDFRNIRIGYSGQMKKPSDRKKIENHAKPFIGTAIDKQRCFSKKQAKELWQEANTNESFDSEVFREDLFGCLVVKGISYSGKENKRKKLAYDLEHIISHSNFGKTVIENGALLNAGINRSKGDKECYIINMNEYFGLKTRYAILPEDLLQELEFSLHDTCVKYNLVFVKNLNTWTLDKNNSGGYSNYDDRYEIIQEETLSDEETLNGGESEDLEDQEESKISPFLIAVGAKYVVENTVLATCSIYNFSQTKIKNTIYKENNEATFETTEIQKKVANATGWIAGVCIGISSLL